MAPAGEFKPRTSAKVRFEFAMNIYTEPAASATETATDSIAPKAQSWRDVLPIHPAAELFPRMSEAELAAVAEDIKVNGLKIPIVLWVPGSKDDYPDDSKPPRFALDGINRLDAMERAGLQLIDEHEPTDPFTSLFYAHAITKYESDTDPYAYVISANIHRRHLTAEQKRDLIAKLIKATPEKSDRQIAKTVKVDHKTVASVRAEKEGRGEIPHVGNQDRQQGPGATGDEAVARKVHPQGDQADQEPRRARRLTRRHRHDHRRHHQLASKCMLAAWHQLAPEGEDHADTAAARGHPRRHRPRQQRRDRAPERPN